MAGDGAARARSRLCDRFRRRRADGPLAPLAPLAPHGTVKVGSGLDSLGSMSMQTTVKELPGSRVEVEVAVPAADVEKGVNRAARSLAREMRLPGFRKGKAPPSLVIQRLGFGPVLEEAIRDSLPEWYERALLDSGVSPIGDPEIAMLSTPEEEGEPLRFKFAVGVRPEAKLGDYRGLEVGKEEKEVPEEIVDTEVERIREGFARLEPVQREAAEGTCW